MQQRQSPSKRPLPLSCALSAAAEGPNPGVAPHSTKRPRATRRTVCFALRFACASVGWQGPVWAFLRVVPERMLPVFAAGRGRREHGLPGASALLQSGSGVDSMRLGLRSWPVSLRC